MQLLLLMHYVKYNYLLNNIGETFKAIILKFLQIDFQNLQSFQRRYIPWHRSVDFDGKIFKKLLRKEFQKYSYD